jgi:hypothetical protein
LFQQQQPFFRMQALQKLKQPQPLFRVQALQKPK